MNPSSARGQLASAPPLRIGDARTGQESFRREPGKTLRDHLLHETAGSSGQICPEGLLGSLSKSDLYQSCPESGDVWYKSSLGLSCPGFEVLVKSGQAGDS